MGVSFAIPIELAMDVAKQLRTTGKVSRGWLGVLIQDVTRELAESFSMSRPYGALVAQIVPGSPAAESGLQVGDVIVEFNGREVPTSGALPPMVGRISAGEEVEVGIVRNGERQSLELRIGELPEDPRAALGGAPNPSEAPESEPDRVERLGLRLKPLDEETRQQLGLPDGETGLVVTEITGGPARDAQLRVGDVITQFGGEPVGSVEALRERVSALAPGTRVPVLVRRDAGPRFFALAIPE
jgi:serine protease Do